MKTFPKNKIHCFCFDPFVKVWPGNTAFPDFFKPETSGWWNTQLKGFHSQVQFDGVWLVSIILHSRFASS